MVLLFVQACWPSHSPYWGLPDNIWLGATTNDFSQAAWHVPQIRKPMPMPNLSRFTTSLRSSAAQALRAWFWWDGQWMMWTPTTTPMRSVAGCVCNSPATWYIIYIFDFCDIWHFKHIKSVQHHTTPILRLLGRPNCMLQELKKLAGNGMSMHVITAALAVSLLSVCPKKMAKYLKL